MSNVNGVFEAHLKKIKIEIIVLKVVYSTLFNHLKLKICY